MALVFILLLCSIYTVSGQGVDPCSSYTLIQNSQRNVNNTKTSDLCDRLLKTGWYRFKDAEIPFDKCISQYHCGTHIPLWIQGKYPSVTDGMVTRKACADLVSNDNNCCDYQVEVAVKNCQSYLVYYLQPVSGCSMSYCTDKSPVCTGAEYSKTGFPPCTDSYPILTQAPTLSNPVITTTDYEFRCHIPYPPNKQDAIFEVTWLINGRTSIHTETLTAGQRDATLSGAALEGHLNTALSCAVVSRFVDNHTGGLKSPSLNSNSYWAGVKASTSHITLSQTAPDYQVSLISTIPVVCRHSVQKGCSVTFQLTTDNENISPSTCRLTLKPTDWNPVTSTAQTTFVVGTKPSIILTPSSHSNIHISITNRPGKEWNNYQVPTIQVSAMSNKPGAHCASTGDPHYRTFDNNKPVFTNLHVGQYTLVKQKRGTFKVETRTWKDPRGKASFNCGVAAREGNDVVTVDMCDGRWGQTYPKLEIKNPSMFENKTEIVKDPSGNHFVIKFRSGAVLKVQRGKGSFLNVFLYVPGTFMGNTEGLCGTFDGKPGNDLFRSTGQTDSFSSYPYYPYTFIESWRIPHGTSLFDKAEPLPVANIRQDYCACTSQPTAQQCNPPPSSKPSITDFCTGCKPVHTVPGALPLPLTTVLPQSSTGATMARAPTTVGATATTPHASHTTYVFPPATEQPESVTFISRPDATRHCMDLLDKYPSAKTCINKLYQLQFTDIVTMCVTDIELTGDKDMGLSALSTMMEGCGFQALIDPKNVVNGTFTLPPDAKVCPGACAGNGDCQNGICACVPGFEGSDCSVKTTEPPMLTAISGGSTCDRLSQQCNRPVMLGENMKANITKCRIRHVYYSDFGSSTIDITATNVDAEFMSTHHVTCPLPKDPYHVVTERTQNETLKGVCKMDTVTQLTDYQLTVTQLTLTHLTVTQGNSQALQGYMILLTNNVGESKEILYSIYSSKCMVCDDHSTCTVKHDTCMIENNCYGDGDRDLSDNQGWCVPSVSNTKWTKQPPSSPTGTTNAAAVTHAPVALPSSTVATQGVADVNHYTAVGTGCGCYFEPSKSDCACCQNYGCPCDAANKHVCFDCMNPAMCNSKP